MVCFETPTSRATSSAFRPASSCLSAPIICASVCWLFDINSPFRNVKLYSVVCGFLILLVERRDQLVGREEIVARLWGKDVFLDTEQGINTAIRKIRLTLGDDPNDPRFLQTIVGKGYRFVGPITVVGATPG